MVTAVEMEVEIHREECPAHKLWVSVLVPTAAEQGLTFQRQVLLECSLTTLQCLFVREAGTVKPKWSWVPAGDPLPFHQFAAELLQGISAVL